ncbi:hypothetical protein AAFC00_006655 [Neodothiora populina]|uniref:Uncharacterized protein n=1 Tax=Neodothiora populina TaxID=2781224 RepID=A0ABR3PAR1_9PEZI
MSRLRRLLITATTVAALFWLKLQLDKLKQAYIALEQFSELGFILPNDEALQPSSNSSDLTEDAFSAMLHALWDSLVAEPVDKFAMEKSALKDTRDKTLVVAKVEGENTKWIPFLLPNWRHAIYVTNDRSAPLHTARNKGHEANAYLTFIIDNYHRLPQTVVFLHGHFSSWHNEQNTAKALQLLNIDLVQENGYVNLRCHHDPGCPAEIQPFRNQKFRDTRGGKKRTTEMEYATAWRELLNSTDVPERVGVACCAQFAVSRTAVLSRPREHYIWFHKWLMKTKLADEVSGRIFEYMWHVIFGKDPVYCPPMHECYLDLYNTPGIV